MLIQLAAEPETPTISRPAGPVIATLLRRLVGRRPAPASVLDALARPLLPLRAQWKHGRNGAGAKALASGKSRSAALQEITGVEPIFGSA